MPKEQYKSAASVGYFDLEVREEPNPTDVMVNVIGTGQGYVLWAPESDPYCADKSELAVE